jgi:hypothetical protein
MGSASSIGPDRERRRQEGLRLLEIEELNYRYSSNILVDQAVTQIVLDGPE